MNYLSSEEAPVSRGERLTKRSHSMGRNCQLCRLVSLKITDLCEIIEQTSELLCIIWAQQNGSVWGKEKGVLLLLSKIIIIFMYDQNLLPFIENWQGLDFNTTQEQIHKSNPQEGFGMWRVSVSLCLAGHRIVQQTQEWLAMMKDKLMGKACSVLGS